eukprot:295838-Pelagomonas_calceolata.AAC.5
MPTHLTVLPGKHSGRQLPKSQKGGKQQPKTNIAPPQIAPILSRPGSSVEGADGWMDGWMDGWVGGWMHE